MGFKNYMIALSCSEITKSYSNNTILNGISFGINAGDKVGLIGNNGAGKSTLFKILCSEIDPDSGQIFISKGLKIGYLHQNTYEDDQRNIFEFCLEIFSNILKAEQKLRSLEDQIAKVSDNGASTPQSLLDEYSHQLDLFTQINGYGYKSEIRGVLFGLGFSENEFDMPVNSLSGGQKSRLSIARLLLSNPDILLLDEPTNHLDIDSVNWLESYLNNYKGTVIVITHDRYFLDKVVNIIFELDHGKMLSHFGTYSDFIKYKQNVITAQTRAFEKQKKEIKRQEELITRFKQRGTEKLAKRAASREKQLKHITRLDAPTSSNKKMSIKLHIKRESGKDVLSVKNLSMSFSQNSEKTPLFKNVNFDIYAGDKIGIIGANGVGKTTLFKIILSKLTQTSGTVDFGYHVYTGYYDQQQKDVSDNRDLITNISDEYPHMDITDIRTLLGSFLFYGDEVFKETKKLSGGEKSRLALLKLMLSGANLLLLDEPTNHLDIESKEVLEDTLLNYGGTIISISHDRYFLNKVCSKMFELTENGIYIYYGNYDYYQNKKNQNSKKINESQEKINLTKNEKKAIKRQEKKLATEKKAHQKRLSDLENEIHNIELDIEKIDIELCNPDIYKDDENVKSLHNKRKDLTNKLSELYETWEQNL